MAALWGFITIALAIKSLGGALLPLARWLGVQNYHYPLVALMILASYATFSYLLGKQKTSGLGARKPSAVLWIGIVIAVLGLGIRVHKINTTRINAAEADMLPNLLAGLKDVSEGKNPYRPHYLEARGELSHFYPPALWIPYVPFYVLGIDVRYLNLLAVFVFYLLLFEAFSRLRSPPTRWSLAFVFLLATHAFSRQAVHEVSTLHTGSVWLFLDLFVWACLRSKVRLQHLAFALLLFSRETAAPLLLPYFFYQWKHQRQGAKQLTGWVAGAAAVLVLPFLLIDAKGFFAPMIHYAALSKKDPAFVMLSLPGFLGFLKKAGVMWLQWPCRLSGCGLALFLIWKKPSLALPQLLGLCGLSYLVFIQFVSTAWPYVYAPLIQWAFFLYLTTAPARVDKIGE